MKKMPRDSSRFAWPRIRSRDIFTCKGLPKTARCRWRLWAVRFRLLPERNMDTDLCFFIARNFHASWLLLVTMLVRSDIYGLLARPGYRYLGIGYPSLG